MSRGPGRWQQIIVGRLEGEEGFLLFDALVEALQRTPTHAEYSAMYRAAVLLDQRGGCTVERVWGENSQGHRAPLVWVCRPGIPVKGIARTAYEARRGIRPPA